MAPPWYLSRECGYSWVSRVHCAHTQDTHLKNAELSFLVASVWGWVVDPSFLLAISLIRFPAPVGIFLHPWNLKTHTASVPQLDICFCINLGLSSARIFHFYTNIVFCLLRAFSPPFRQLLPLCSHLISPLEHKLVLMSCLSRVSSYSVSSLIIFVSVFWMVHFFFVLPRHIDHSASFNCLFICVCCTAHAWAPRVQKRALGPLEQELQMVVCTTQCVCWELKSGSLPEQCTLLTSVLFL